MNFEDIMLMKEATYKSAKTESLFLCKIPKVVKFIEAESKTAYLGTVGRE